MAGLRVRRMLSGGVTTWVCIPSLTALALICLCLLDCCSEKSSFEPTSDRVWFRSALEPIVELDCDWVDVKSDTSVTGRQHLRAATLINGPRSSSQSSAIPNGLTRSPPTTLPRHCATHLRVRCLREQILLLGALQLARAQRHAAGLRSEEIVRPLEWLSHRARNGLGIRKELREGVG